MQGKETNFSSSLGELNISYHCYGLNVSQDSYVEVLAHNMTIIKVNEVIRWVYNPIGHGMKRGRHTWSTHTQERPCEDTVRRRPPTSQEERPYRNQPCSAP